MFEEIKEIIAQNDAGPTVSVAKSGGTDDEPIETVKIGGLRKAMQKARPTNAVAEDSEEYVTKSIGLKKLSKEHAVILFKEYSAVLTAQKRVSLASFFADPLLEINGGTISFTVGSKLVADEIKEEQRKIISFFAEKDVELEGLECVVNALEISEYKVFTPKQQFDVLAKEHPILKDFESRFNLEIDG